MAINYGDFLASGGGGGGSPAPTVTQAEFLANYPTPLGDEYWYCPTRKKFVPKEFATGPVYGPNGFPNSSYSNVSADHQGAVAFTASDGTVWTGGLFANTSAATGAYVFGLYKKLAKSRSLQTDTVSDIIVNQTSAAPENTDTLFPVKCGTDRWVTICGGSQIVSGTNIKYIIDMEYDAGTGSMTITSTSATTQISTNTVATRELTCADLVYDPTNSNVYICFSDSNNPIQWVQYDLGTKTIPNTGTFASNNNINSTSYNGKTFRYIYRLSDGNFFLSGLTPDIVEWTGSGFSSVAGTTIPAIPDQERHVILGENTWTRSIIVNTTGAVTYTVCTYDPGTLTITTETFSGAFASSAIQTTISTSSNANMHMHVGDGLIMLFADEVVGWFKINLTDFSFEDGNITQLFQNNLTNNHTWRFYNVDEDFQCYCCGCGVWGQTAAASNYILSLFSGGRMADGYAPFPAAALISEASGTLTLQITRPFINSENTVTVNQRYGDFIALSDTVLVPVDKKASPLWGALSYNNMSDVDISSVNMFDAQGVVNNYATFGLSAQTNVNFLEGKAKSIQAWPVSSGSIQYYVFAIAVDGIIVCHAQGDITNTSTFREYLKWSGESDNFSIAFSTSSSPTIDLDAKVEF